jgi:hypothetical protein
MVFGGLLNLCFILCHSPYTFLNGFITLGILNEIWYSSISCMKTNFLLGFTKDVITNGNKHLGTFESPIIHYPIFNVKNLNLMEFFPFKIFNNLLRKEGK